jgi:hypothetical protein|tara:strand:- start:60 stop:659 length:600 start_codon:yes stop_codon:yes gene_type:complete
MAVYLLKFEKGHRGTGAQGHRPAPRLHGSTVPLNHKAQINFGFIIAVVLLMALVIAATTGILNMLPSIKREAQASALEPRAFVIGKLLLEDPGYPAEWYSSTVQRVGLAHYNSYSGKTVLGRLNSSKIDYINTISYNTIAHQLGLANDTGFRLRLTNASGVILDINLSSPGATSSVYVLQRALVIDNNSIANATLEVWE